MHVGGFHAVSGLQGLAGASKGLQGHPGAFGGSRDVEGPPKPPKTWHFERKMRPPRTAKAGRAGLGHPPWQGGVGGVARLRCVCKGE